MRRRRGSPVQALSRDRTGLRDGKTNQGHEQLGRRGRRVSHAGTYAVRTSQNFPQPNQASRIASYINTKHARRPRLEYQSECRSCFSRSAFIRIPRSTSENGQRAFSQCRRKPLCKSGFVWPVLRTARLSLPTSTATRNHSWVLHRSQSLAVATCWTVIERNVPCGRSSRSTGSPSSRKRGFRAFSSTPR